MDTRFGAILLLLLASCKTPDPDVDGDGFAASVDCDDQDAAKNPDATEVCNGEDDDCDDATDEGLATVTSFRDLDDDSFGDPEAPLEGCAMPDGHVLDDTDCDDGQPDIYPGATEFCNLVDDDCDTDVDEGLDVDWYLDDDGDGYGDPDVTESACARPEGYVTDDTDCDDAASTTHPGAEEVCNLVDDDCDTFVNEDPVDGLDFPADADGDGFGSPEITVYGCDGLANTLDCDDDDPAEPKVVDIVTGAPDGDGTSAAPFDSIRAGMAAASACVVVYPGAYAEAIDFGGKDLSVVGIHGAAETIIDASEAEGLRAVVTFAAGEEAARLSGFTLTGGSGRLEVTSESVSCGSGITCTNYYYSYCGGGVAVEGASPTLTDLVVIDNVLPVNSVTTEGYDTTYVSSFGGGVCLQSAGGAVLSGVDLYENYADQGGGLYADLETTLQLSQSRVLANTATDGGGLALDGANASLTNVIVAWNTAADTGGGIAANAGTFGAWNTTFGFNAAVSGGGLYFSGTGTATLDSSVVYASNDGSGVQAVSGATFTGTYNDVYGNLPFEYVDVADPTGTLGNLSVDPLFLSVTVDDDPYNDDWRLGDGSPAIDAGNPALLDPDGTIADQGAYGGPGGGW